jgi:Ca2+-binding EF-hand superfamily protein
MIASAATFVIAGVGLAGLSSSSATAAMPDVLVERLNQGAVIGQYVAQVVGTLRSADRAGDGLDRDDVTLAREQQWAQMRASAVSEVLRQDLNGDFKVTRDEMLRAARGEEPYRTRQIETQLDRYDSNGDGIITLPEAAAAAGATTGSYGQDRALDALLALDPNKDGKITAEELRHIAERAFESVDRDGDGKISQAEYMPIGERVREARQVRSMPTCALPPVPAGAKLIVYGGYEGAAISSVAIGGLDQETNLIDVTIEPGTTPLYLILTSYESMLWRLTGATDRVTRVVVSSSHTGRATMPAGADGMKDRRTAIDTMSLSMAGAPSASGVSGVPADKVTIASSNCPRPFYNSGGDKLAMVPVQHALGRDPDAIFTSYSVRRVSLPSGIMTKTDSKPPPPPGFDAAMWQEAVRYWPGGLVTVDSRHVVARTRVERYQVLPSQMGLAQWIGAGAIEALANDKFRIVRPIPHMPPSMGGAHSVTLVLAKGIPLPPGDPVHSCVLSEETGEALRPGARCR